MTSYFKALTSLNANSLSALDNPPACPACPASISATNAASDIPRRLAASSSSVQNSSSSETLVACPAMTTDRFFSG